MRKFLARNNGVFFEGFEAQGESSGIDDMAGFVGNEGLLQLTEAFWASKELSDYEQNPHITNKARGLGDGAGGAFFLSSLFHVFVVKQIIPHLAS